MLESSLQNETIGLGRMSFAYTPTQYDYHLDPRRHSFATSDSDFINNLFSVNLETPKSAIVYMNNLYSQSSSLYPATAISSMVGFEHNTQRQKTAAQE
ncbi:hypothetical protein RIF29_19412 [Crotalaria pallida]|uniref:Uncharacterized protein n=1 Tax=Crotalaria pallida TaxID=3830 RepID=A0AAN9F3G1_CROPI